MTGSPSKAVFLSHASEDTAAAKKICDALRAKGIEVWFDQSELRGGDAWDRKIRQQIAECALFIPLISTKTNARGEGYFRLEWKLAVDRSHLMADDEAFLFPIAIEEFSDAAARVPDRFRQVHWARLGASDTPESIAERVSKLLAGDEREATSNRPSAAPPMRRRGGSRYFWPIVGVLIALSLAYRPLWQSTRDANPVASATAPEASASEAAQLARRAIGQATKFKFKRDDLAIAAEFARRASEKDPSLALAWGARASVEAMWLLRGWDLGASRLQATEDFAKRALALDPEEAHALWSQGMVLMTQRALPEAIARFQRALRRAPEDNQIRRSLAAAYRVQGRTEEALTTLEEALRRNPRDALAHYDSALVYSAFVTLKDNDPASIDRSLEHLDRALGIEVFSGALVLKAAVLAGRKGDLGAARATLERLAELPPEDATEDRAIFFRMWVALLEREPARALAAAALTTSNYFADNVVAQPVAWMKALAHQQAGRANLAAEEWLAAEGVLRTRLAENPNSLLTQAELAISLAMLGRKEEAAKQFVRYDAARREQGRPGTLSHVRYYAAIGDAKRTVAALREARKTPTLWVTDAVLARDPWFDAVRDKVEFKALLRESETKK